MSQPHRLPFEPCWVSTKHQRDSRVIQTLVLSLSPLLGGGLFSLSSSLPTDAALST